MPINHSEIENVILIPARVVPRRLEIHPFLKALTVSLKKWKKQKQKCSHNLEIDSMLPIATLNTLLGLIFSTALCRAYLYAHCTDKGIETQ